MDDICDALLGYALKRVVLGAHDYPESHKRLYPGDVLSVSRWGNLYEHLQCTSARVWWYTTPPMTATGAATCG